MTDWHQASLVIGFLTFLLVAAFFLVKWIVGAVAGHAAVIAFFEWRRRRRRKQQQEDHDGIE